MEGAGPPYAGRCRWLAALKPPAPRALHPFGRIPTHEEGDLVLFESGAIVLHVAGRRPGLLPKHDAARARAVAWMFAALDTVELPILELATARLLEAAGPDTRSACS